MEIIKSDDVNYPQQLKQLADYPDEIYFLGEQASLQGRLLAIVGARDIKISTREWMESELFPVLKELEVGVVSGGARGVDQQAHWLAVRASVPTVVVLPSGLRNIYPKTLEKFVGNKNVSLLTEYNFEVEMRKHHFYKRNRIIAALAPVTLVLQASEKSGTMITAKKAMDLGCCVATLPGMALDSAFSGNNQLLFDGAMMVRNQKDLTQLLLSEL